MYCVRAPLQRLPAHAADTAGLPFPDLPFIARLPLAQLRPAHMSLRTKEHTATAHFYRTLPSDSGGRVFWFTYALVYLPYHAALREAKYRT